MQSKVIDYDNTRIDYKMFEDKKTAEPQVQHKLSTKNWEVVAIDLFGPMPSSSHVIVVRNLGSRYLASTLGGLKKAEKFIPALKKIYTLWKP